VDWIEPLPTSHPQKTFAGVDDGETGIAILNQGLPEYEVYDDESRTFALTLMRSVIGGVMGAENQIQGEMLGTWTFRYSIYPYQGSWEEAKVWKQGHQFNAPLRSAQTSVHEGSLSMEKSFVQADPDAFIMTALKKADREDAVVVRGFNAGTSPIEAVINVDGFNTAVQTNLNEEPEAKPKKSPAKAKLPAKRMATFMFTK
jgi:alpha-mannosidase/octanoyl-[GcvH]:protein N-octanoyltransferase